MTSICKTPTCASALAYDADLVDQERMKGFFGLELVLKEVTGGGSFGKIKSRGSSGTTKSTIRLPPV